ncbi:hypothetical protein [Heliomicrobium undosum]|uniref:hypothetical protein n=1 Tax=Heliomicrobium undosum TaxID=121734 RepID=UPI001F35BE2A|nr:hypothetical protein [Heliomicrobium undosum]
MQGGTRPWLNAGAVEQIEQKKQITQAKQIKQKGKPKKTGALPHCWKNIGKSEAL